MTASHVDPPARARLGVAPWWRPAALVLAGVAALACGRGSAGSDGAAAAEEAPPTAAEQAAELPAPAPPADVRGRELLAEATSEFSKTRIRQAGSRRSMVFVREHGDEFPQTIIDLRDPDRPHHAYAEAVATAMIVRPEPARILIVGLGGGTLVRFFHHFLPASRIDAVEIDAEVVRLAAEWFGVVPGPRLRVFTDDGVRFLAGDGERYDLIVLDAFLDPGRPGTDSAGIPKELRGLGFLQRVRARLRPGGVAAFNIHFKSGYREHVDAIASVFPRVYVAKVRHFGQRIIYALEDEGPQLTADELMARARALEGTAEWGFSFAEYAAHVEPWQRTP